MRRILALAAALALPIVLQGQSVPLLALDIAGGGSSGRTMQTVHTYYGLDGPVLLRATATVRLGTAGRFRPILVAEHSSSCPTDNCGDVAVCYYAPVGGCSQHLPDPDGNAIGAGVAGRFGQLWLVQTTAGVTDYWNRGRFVDVTVAVSPAAHFAFTAGARHIVGRDRSGDDIWFFPRSFGIRVQ